jgi:hypothetical protein
MNALPHWEKGATSIQLTQACSVPDVVMPHPNDFTNLIEEHPHCQEKIKPVVSQFGVHALACPLINS